MHILVLSTWLPYPPNNGSKIRAHYLIRALAERHDVTVISFGPPSDGPIQGAPEGIRLHVVPADPFQWVNLPQAIKFLSPMPLALWPIREMRERVAAVARSTTFDVVVAVESPVAQYGLQLPGLPRILDVDTALCYQMRERYLAERSSVTARLRTWISWRKAQGAERSLFRRYQTCIVVAAHELAYLESMIDSQRCRVTALPNGVDCERNRPGLAPKRPGTLIYSGALTYRANYDAMVYFLSTIYPRVRQRCPEVSLTITGSTLGVDLSALGLDASVQLSGQVEDIRPVVGGSSVCVVPLREGAGTRIKILEAMALGTPVISTRKGAEGLEVIDGKHLLIADDPTQFAELTVQLLGDGDLRQFLAANARRLVEERYDWRSIGQRFVALVEETVQRSEGGGRHA